MRLSLVRFKIASFDLRWMVSRRVASVNAPKRGETKFAPEPDERLQLKECFGTIEDIGEPA